MTIMTIDNLAKKIKRTPDTLKTYLCRAEFSHIELAKLDKKIYVVKNITNKDIKRLKELTNRVRARI